MIINKTIIRNLENKCRAHIPDELKQYLLVKYAQEPFPYEYSEQDLYANIERDMETFGSDRLDVTIKTPLERWQDECEYLQRLYVEKACEIRQLLEYVAELEQTLSEHGLESVSMAGRRSDSLDI